MAAGLPREGRSAEVPNAGDLAREDVPTCYFRDPLEKAAGALSDEGFCVAVDEDRVVLGMLYAEDLEKARGPEEAVEEAMHPGPTTIRALEPLEPLVERMRRAGVDGILVTNAEGVLLGLLRRDEAAEALERLPQGSG